MMVISHARYITSPLTNELFGIVDISVGIQTRDQAKQGYGRLKNIADPMIFNQSTRKSVSYAHAARMGMEKHAKSISLLHLTSKE
jgi:hypothetical protein